MPGKEAWVFLATDVAVTPQTESSLVGVGAATKTAISDSGPFMTEAESGKRPAIRGDRARHCDVGGWNVTDGRL